MRQEKETSRAPKAHLTGEIGAKSKRRGRHVSSKCYAQRKKEAHRTQAGTMEAQEVAQDPAAVGAGAHGSGSEDS